jgi:hypothetical protein
MLLIKANYFISFLTLLSLVVCQILLGDYHIINSGSTHDVLVASALTPNSPVEIDPMGNNRGNLAVWTFNPIGGNNIYNIVIHGSPFHLSFIGNKIVISQRPTSWLVVPNRPGQYRLSPIENPPPTQSLDIGNTAGKQVLNLAPSSSSNTQSWIIVHP